MNEPLERVELQVDDVRRSRGNLLGTEPFLLVDEQKFPVAIAYSVERVLGEVVEILTLGFSLIEENIALIIAVEMDLVVCPGNVSTDEQLFFRSFSVRPTTSVWASSLPWT